MTLEIGARQEQGRRPYQEDEILISRDSQGGLFGVFDGHAGNRCSKFIASSLKDALLESKSYDKNIKAAFIETYRNINNRFLAIADQSRWNDGSTGLCVSIRNGKITVANVGDCRVVVVTSHAVEQLSNDHKPYNRNEMKRILALGGNVVNCYGVHRVNGILAVSRAFGNRTLRDVIRPDPELHERQITMNDYYIVIASDGVWDTISNKDIFKACWQLPRRSCQQIASSIIDLSLLFGSQDNVSCIVIGIHDYATKMKTAQISPPYPLNPPNIEQVQSPSTVQSTSSTGDDIENEGETFFTPALRRDVGNSRAIVRTTPRLRSSVATGRRTSLGSTGTKSGTLKDEIDTTFDTYTRGKSAAPTAMTPKLLKLPPVP